MTIGDPHGRITNVSPDARCGAGHARRPAGIPKAEYASASIEAGDSQRAIEHYTEFLRRAGPEYGARLTDVRRRLDTLSPSASR